MKNLMLVLMVPLLLLPAVCFSQEKTAVELYDDAVELNNQQRFEEALVLLKKCVELEPENIWYHYAVGVNLGWSVGR